MRALRALLTDASAQSQPYRPILTPAYRSTRQRRHATSLSQVQIAHDDKDLPFDRSTQALGISPVPKRHLELELRGLRDKFALAEHVQSLLSQKQNFDKALALVQLASSSSNRQGECIVAWNHLLRFLTAKGDTEKAWHLFNDMKKRAQFPDSHTYIALFKGLNRAKTPDGTPSAKNVERVVHIYNQMYAENSRCRPSTIHANAALQTCSLASDMDSIWEIVSKLDEEGANSANGITYTVLLNALRSNAIKQIQKSTDAGKNTSTKLRAVREGVKIWEDVVRKWRSGLIELDEKLATAMAQLLLLSPRAQDWRCVFDLILQTMNVPIPQRILESPQLAALSIAEHEAKPFEHIAAAAQSGKKKMHTFAWAKPGPATTTVLIEACLVNRVPQAADDYWTTLTDQPFNVRPDLVNLERFLKMCSIARLSDLATSRLQDTITRYGITPRKETVDLAMVACKRQTSAQRSLSPLDRILDVMAAKNDEPDLATLFQYLLFALESQKSSQALHALAKLDPIEVKLSSMVVQGSVNAAKRANWASTLSEVSALYQCMIGMADTLLLKQLVAAEQRQSLEDLRKRLTRTIGTIKSRLEDLGIQAVSGTRRRTARSAAPGGEDIKQPEINVDVSKYFDALAKFRAYVRDDITAPQTRSAPERPSTRPRSRRYHERSLVT